MTFRPYPTRSGFFFIGLAFIVVTLAGWLLTRLGQQTDPFIDFWLVIGLLVLIGFTFGLLYLALVAFRLHYHLTRNGLTIQWGLKQYRIPLHSIEQIISGSELSPVLQSGGLNLLGLRWGRSELIGQGVVWLYTTAPLTESLLIVTDTQGYLISPDRPADFILAWQARRPLGPTQQWSPGVRRSWPLSSPLFSDSFLWGLMGLTGFTCLALFGYLFYLLPDLPPVLPLHFNTLGEPDRIAAKTTLLLLPTGGAITGVVNFLLGYTIYWWEKMAAYLLWGGALIMQFCLWGAILTIVG